MKLLESCGCFPTGRHYPGIAHLLSVEAVGVAHGFDADGAWLDHPIAFIDTETTGLDPKTERIIELGIVLGRGGEIVARHNWLVNPGIPIPRESTEVHGIRDEDVADKPSFKEILPEVLACLGDAVAGAYNAGFDRGFVLAEVARAGGPILNGPPALEEGVDWLDPLVFAREMWKGQGESRALAAVAERLGIALERAHRATDDAEAALRVFYAMAPDARLPKSYGALVREQRRLARQQQEAQRFWRK